MKNFLVLVIVFFHSAASFAGADCTKGIESFLSTVAPKTGRVTLSGSYIEKSSSGVFKPCQLSIGLENNDLEAVYTHDEFNPLHGDGGAFWPFGSYPTFEIASDEYRSLHYFTCVAGSGGFSIDYSYRNLSGWYETKRYSLGLLQNADGTYDASLIDGGDRSNPVTCRGTLSEP